jgi:hypothetical protein
MSSIVFALVLSQGSIVSDPRLALPVGFDDSLEPISIFLDKAAAASGVIFKVDPSLSYLKIDAFVEDEPLGTTLAKVAEVFDLVWQQDGNGYKLVQEKATAQQIESYINDEDHLVTQVVDKQLAVYRLINMFVPESKKPWPRGVNRFENWKPTYDAAKAELEAAKSNGADDEKIYALEVKCDALEKISEGFPNLQLARIFARMTPNDISNYRAGMPYIGANTSEARYHFSEGDIKPNEALPTSQGIKSVVFTRLDPGSKRIGSKELTFFGNSFSVGAEPASPYPFDEIAPNLKKKPFAAKLKEWDQSETFPKVLTKPMDVDADTIVDRKSPWFGNRSRLGDILRWFHLVTNMPVIAPADRVIHPFIKLYRGVKTQGEYVSDLLKACHGYGRKSDDYLLVRDGVFWRKSKDEIPEQTYAKLESNRGLTLKDFAHFASDISRTQAMLVQDPNGVVVKFARNKFGEAYPALQFLDSLTPDQIEDAKKPVGLSFRAFSASQQDLFRAAIVEGLTDRGFVSEQLLTRFVADRFTVENLPLMVFHIRQMLISATYNAESAVDLGQIVELVPKRSYPNRRTVNFEFAYDQFKTITFSTEDF